MSQTIATVSSDKRLILSNGQAARAPVYGSSWTKIRIGLRLSFPAVATLAGTPTLVVGMCNGPAGPTDLAFGNTTTTNFVGVRTNAASWTFGGSAGTTGYFGSPISFECCKKLVSTITGQGSTLGGGGAGLYLSATDIVRSVYLVQIEKGSPNYTFRIVGPNTLGAAQTDVTDAQFKSFMELDAALTSPNLIVANYVTLQSNNTLAASEVAGVLDHLNIYWDKTSVALNISDVAHRLVA